MTLIIIQPWMNTSYKKNKNVIIHPAHGWMITPHTHTQICWCNYLSMPWSQLIFRSERSHKRVLSSACYHAWQTLIMLWKQRAIIVSVWLLAATNCDKKLSLHFVPQVWFFCLHRNNFERNRYEVMWGHLYGQSNDIYVTNNMLVVRN